jgi:type II secretory pathway component GspD/PulD (secretin)
MKRMTLVLVLATVFSLGLRSSASAQVNLEARITISFTSVPPAMLFRSVATMSHFVAEVDPVLQKPVSITLEDVTLRTLLNAICDSVGCRWSIDGNGNRIVVEALPPDPSRGRTWIEPQGRAMPPGMQFVNSPVRAVLDAIARVAGEGFDYRVDEVDANQPVTVDVSHQNVLRAIAMVVKAAGLKPGSPYTITLRRPGQKLTIIKAIVPKSTETDDFW